ncbi:DegT/DnrJ/EryC1/StrS family aminotransferase [Gaoshiqia sp. Z1-71]|uniref:DegT/DnrJ/EryC1/StrS family aminotransferase n=1 Tax=Gaoshiqia hydrogeniformans TaxID=3290090 RepID=UPI003BF906B4
MPKDLPELNNILHSGALAYGQWGRMFEKKLGEYIGSSNIAVVNSFNSAMLIVLTTLGIKHGDEIIASPMSCLASNQPFVTIGAKVIWADIDPNTGTLDPDNVKEKITAKTKAIFHNHHCGYPGYIDEINAIGKAKGIYVVDDAIEAFGSKYKGNLIGNTGSDATVFSFQTVRLPNTIDGGALCISDNNLFEKAKRARDLGVNRTLFRDSSGEISKEYDISEPGYGATLSEVNSYIGYTQMEQLESLLAKQTKNAAVWKEKIASDYLKYHVLGKSTDKPNYWIFGILAPDKKKAIIQFRELNFYASGVHLPNSNYSVFGKRHELPGVIDFYSRFVALPCGWWFKKNNEDNV